MSGSSSLRQSGCPPSRSFPLAPRPRALKHSPQIPPRVAGFDFGNVLRRTLGNARPAINTALWPQVDDPIRGLNHLEVMLNDDQSISLVPKLYEDIEQLADICEMKPGRRFIQDIHRA